MDASEARRIGLANLERLRDDLRLWEWRIDLYIGRLDGHAVAECQVNAPYCQASITLDSDKLDTETDVLRALRHELVHVFCWPMHAYGQHASDLTDNAAIDASWTFYLERMVWSVEQLMDRHGIPLEVKGEEDGDKGQADGPVREAEDEERPAA